MEASQLPLSIGIVPKNEVQKVLIRSSVKKTSNSRPPKSDHSTSSSIQTLALGMGEEGIFFEPQKLDPFSLALVYLYHPSVLVGVGDGPWDTMEEFDDQLPGRR